MTQYYSKVENQAERDTKVEAVNLQTNAAFPAFAICTQSPKNLTQFDFLANLKEFTFKVNVVRFVSCMRDYLFFAFFSLRLV